MLFPENVSHKVDHAFKKDFQYTHDNPYHEKLDVFKDFVLRDDEAETHQGKWNKQVFDNQAPLELEIGTGYGHFMINYCQNNPHVNFVGLDYRFKRSFQLANRLSKVENKNFRYLRAKGERLSHLFAPNELNRIYYFFPDPWPKTRHHKKRLFQKPFLDAAFETLAPNGEIFIKTDHDGYFSWMQRVLKDENRFEVLLETTDLHKEHCEHFLAINTTKFEKIFLKKNKNINALVLRVKK